MITEQQLIEAIRQVAATEPDRIYYTDWGGPTCNYLPNRKNTCGCIVGEALSLLGIPREKLEALDALGATLPGSAWGSRATQSELAGLLTLEALESPWVCMVQQKQDAHYTWAHAVEYADRHEELPAQS